MSAAWGNHSPAEAAPTEAASACSEFLTPNDAPTTVIDRIKDFLAGCVLAVAMSVMEEPRHAGRINPRKASTARAALWSVLILAAMAALLFASQP